MDLRFTTPAGGELLLNAWRFRSRRDNVKTERRAAPRSGCFGTERSLGATRMLRGKAWLCLCRSPFHRLRDFRALAMDLLGST